MKIFRFAWELPQIMIGVFLLLLFLPITRLRYKLDYGTTVIVLKIKLQGAFTVGPFIFLPSSGVNSKLIKHEFGHRVQSMLLGPWYLVGIMIPGFIWFWIYVIFLKKSKIRYEYPIFESTACALGTYFLVNNDKVAWGD